MRAALLHLDDSLIAQPALAARVASRAGQAIDLRDIGPQLRLWSRPAALDQLRTRLARLLPPGGGPTLVFAGSGDFHHVTPTLLARAIEGAGGQPVTVVHFDNHPDWVRFAKGTHCGSWVGQAARLPQVSKVVTVGPCSSDIGQPRRADLDLLVEGRLELYAYRAPGGECSLPLTGKGWPTIEAMGESAFAAFLPGRIATEAVYVTIDKDVLCPDDAATNWDQGRMSLSYLKALLEALLSRHSLIGADVVGDWSRPRYGGGLIPRILKRGEAWLDQPHARPTVAAVSANEAVNLQLLDLLAGRCKSLEAAA